MENIISVSNDDVKKTMYHVALSARKNIIFVELNYLINFLIF